MATITNYTTLISNIQAAVEDDSQEVLDYIPTAIALSEERLFKELELPELEIKTTGTLNQGSNTVSKPSGYKFGNYFYITSTSGKVQLIRKREDFIYDYWPDAAEEAEPKYYADATETTLVIAPTPDDDYAYEIKYSKKPSPLSVSNLTNYYTEKCVDSLFYSCLSEIAKFMKAWSQVQVWEERYSASRDTWNLNSARTRRDDGVVPNMPDSGPNSLKHTVQSKS